MALKKIRDFRAPNDAATANELRRQLGELEQNVSNMGDGIALAAMQRLARRSDTQTEKALTVAPGQFQAVDTRLGTISVGLAKPTAAQAGTFIVLVDIGGGAGSIYIQGQGCKYENAAAAFLTVTTFAALIFCDGVNYWKLH